MAELSTMGMNILSDNPPRVLAPPKGGEPVSDRGQWPARAWRWSLWAVVLMTAFAYGPNFRELAQTWIGDPNYSHGFLVIPIAVFILRQRLTEDPPWVLARDAGPAPWWAWALLVAILAVRAVAYERSLQWVENLTILPTLACLAWTLGGWSLLERAWPAILFLVFMLPLPTAVNGMVSLPLQRIATTGSSFLLQLSGLWVIQEGNVINLATSAGMQKLDVALACNGLKMLMCLAATVTATVILIDMPVWKRIALLVSAVPIAMLSNMSRIVATGWSYSLIARLLPGADPKIIKLREWYQEWAHDISGWLMMPLALVLVGLELLLLSWLVAEDTASEEDDRKVFLALLTRRPASKDKASHADLGEL